jgi:hypothetical protein
MPLGNRHLAPRFRNRQYVWTFQGLIIHDLSIYLDFDEYGRGSLVPALINHMRVVPIPPETNEVGENDNHNSQREEIINKNEHPTDGASDSAAHTLSSVFSVSYLIF